MEKKFNIKFVGDDWYNAPKRNTFEEQFNKADVTIIYFYYTQGISSTSLEEIIKMVNDSLLRYKIISTN